MGKKTKACPFCWEKILEVAKKCKHCGEFLPEEKDEWKEEVKQVSGCKKFWAVIGFILFCIIMLFLVVELTNSATGWNKDLKSCEHRLQEKYGDSVYMMDVDVKTYDDMKSIVWYFKKWWKHEFACVKDLTGKKWKNRNWFFMLAVDNKVVSQE
jgi:hypothetical protein